MRHYLAAICGVFLLAACVPEPVAVAPRTGFAIVGAVVSSPNEPGWLLNQASQTSVAFGLAQTPDSTVATAYAFPLPATGSDLEVLQSVQDQRNDTGPNTRMGAVSQKSAPARFKGANCIKYTWVLKDRGRPIRGTTNFQHVKNIGFVCRNPFVKNVGFLIEMSERSSRQTVSSQLSKRANAYFAAVKFTAP